MQICNSLADIKAAIHTQKQQSKTLGLVPTMGALHQGHLSLFARSKQETQCTVGSIFVNPIQFNNPSDLEKYPRTLEKDLELLDKAGCDIVFVPDVAIMYPRKPDMTMSFGAIENVLEGKSRPGHFSGVGVVVSKLFHILEPNVAFFGQKDLQQFLIIKKMVEQLSFPLEVVCCDTLRESDGLAMSSRNVRIPAHQRTLAGNIYQSLITAKALLPNHSITEVKEAIAQYYAPHTDLQLDYFEIVDANTLESLPEIPSSGKVALCVAAVLNEVRLIDNMLVQL